MDVETVPIWYAGACGALAPLDGVYGRGRKFRGGRVCRVLFVPIVVLLPRLFGLARRTDICDHDVDQRRGVAYAMIDFVCFFYKATAVLPMTEALC